MSYFQSITLGLIQGLTEFLPISSSGHLVLVPWLFNWETPGLAFDVALHWGTLTGVVFYFRRDLVELTQGFFGSFQGKRELQNRLPWAIILGTIPAGLMGLGLNDLAESTFRSPWIVAGNLFAVGLVILLAEKTSKQSQDLTGLTWKSALLIGASQGIAAIPGVSRSGISIATALFLSFNRVSSVRYSFLLSIPLIFCAGLLKISFLWGNMTNPVFLAGFFSAAFSGYIAVSFLLAFVKTHTFTPFVVYRVVLALLIVGYLL